MADLTCQMQRYEISPGLFQPERARFVIVGQHGLHNFLFSHIGGNVQWRPASHVAGMQGLRHAVSGQRQIDPFVVFYRSQKMQNRTIFRPYLCQHGLHFNCFHNYAYRTVPVSIRSMRLYNVKETNDQEICSFLSFQSVESIYPHARGPQDFAFNLKTKGAVIKNILTTPIAGELGRGYSGRRRPLARQKNRSFRGKEREVDAICHGARLRRRPVIRVSGIPRLWMKGQGRCWPQRSASPGDHACHAWPDAGSRSGGFCCY